MAAETKETSSEECGNAAPDWKWKQQDVPIPLNLLERRYTGVAVLELPDEEVLASRQPEGCLGDACWW